MIEQQITESAEWQLSHLAEAYASARLVMDTQHPPLDPKIAYDTCRYCRKPWKRFAGTKCEGHALCVVPIDFMRSLVAFTDEHYEVTLATIAARLGVGQGFVRAWWNIVKGNPRR